MVSNVVCWWVADGLRPLDDELKVEEWSLNGGGGALLLKPPVPEAAILDSLGLKELTGWVLPGSAKAGRTRDTSQESYSAVEKSSGIAL